MIEHQARLSALGREQTYKLLPDGLEVTSDGKRDFVTFGDVRAVNLITYPNFGGRHGQMSIVRNGGHKIKVRSHHYGGINDFENRSESYATLVRELSRRVAASNPNARFVTGSIGFRIFWLFMLAVFVVCGVLLILAGLADSDAIGSAIGGVAMAVVLGPFCWECAKMSRQEAFDPNDVPVELIEL